MSGHSKWSTIKRKKALVDARRAKIWTKCLKEIQVAAKMGGADPAGNARLRLAMDKARVSNVPKDRIKAAVDKGTGASGADNLEDVHYEGYGPSGVAIFVEAMTDNRNRTVGEVRHVFERYGGHLGTAGSVAWMFHKRGIIHVLKADAAEERLMEVALDAGASDVRDDGEVWTVDCDPGAFLAVQDALAAAQIAVANAEIDHVPENRIALVGDKAESMMKLLGALEDLDEVHNVYANHDVPEEILEKY